MRRFFKTVSVILLCGILSCQMVEGRGRNNGNTGAGQRPSTTQPQGQRPGGAGSAPSNSGRPGNAPANKPGNQPTGQKPGNHGGNGPAAPGHNYSQTPEHHNPGPGPAHHNPGPGHHNPGPGYHNPGPGHPGPGPGPGHPGPGPHYGAPYHPYMPPYRPYARPVPPPHYVPGPGPIISTILGIALGTTINYAINALPASGYTVSGYGNDAIYLNNVMQLNMLWPHATMYYSNGMLTASEFAYSTGYYDVSRYNLAYSRLAAAYGYPASTSSLAGGGLSSTWWLANGQYIMLQYAPATAANGAYRYYTTLAFGN